MAENSKIEWTDATWNPITGCSVVSPGCTNCYAMRLAGTRLQHHPSRIGLTRNGKAGPVWNGQLRFNEEWLDQPLRWKTPRRIFVCAHGDLFHEGAPDEWIDQVFAVMALAPHHTFQVLTKRPGRMLAYMNEKWQGTPALVVAGLSIPAGGVTGRRVQVERACEAILDRFELADPDLDDLWTEGGDCKAMQWPWPLPNVWLGVSAEDQTRADERIPDLLNTPAAIRFVSIEPMIGPIDLTRIRAPEDNGDGSWKFSALNVGDYYIQDCGDFWESGDGPYREHRVDWVIVGGESGPGARPMHPDLVRSLRDQCVEAGVPFFFKQWGEWISPDDVVATSADTNAACAWWVDGRWQFDRYNMWEASDDENYEHPDVVRIGKKRTGAMLDGREWREMPA